MLGVFAVNRMTVIRQASVDMEATQLPSIGFLGNMTENVLRLRILSFRVLVNRDPAALQEAQTRIGVLVDKVRTAQTSYAALPASPEEAALYKTFATTLDNYMQAQSQMLELSRQNKLDEMRTLINTRIKEGTDQMGEQLNKLVALNAVDAKNRVGQGGRALQRSLYRHRDGGGDGFDADRAAGLAVDPQHPHAAEPCGARGRNHCRRQPEQGHRSRRQRRTGAFARCLVRHAGQPAQKPSNRSLAPRRNWAPPPKSSAP